jgi:hypothetical protein
MCRTVVRWIAIALVTSSWPSIAAAPSLRHFVLADHGRLLLAVPDAWKDSVGTPQAGMPQALWFTPRNGASFNVLITPMSAVSLAAAVPDVANLRVMVGSAARKAESQSVETSLPLQELVGPNGRGYYFFATDRAPAPGEWKYLTQGMIRIGPIALAFTILTNDGQEAVAKAALEMIRLGAYQRGSSSEPLTGASHSTT